MPSPRSGRVRELRCRVRGRDRASRCGARRGGWVVSPSPTPDDGNRHPDRLPVPRGLSGAEAPAARLDRPIGAVGLVFVLVVLGQSVAARLLSGRLGWLLRRFSSPSLHIQWVPVCTAAGLDSGSLLLGVARGTRRPRRPRTVLVLCVLRVVQVECRALGAETATRRVLRGSPAGRPVRRRASPVVIPAVSTSVALAS